MISTQDYRKRSPIFDTPFLRKTTGPGRHNPGLSYLHCDDTERCVRLVAALAAIGAAALAGPIRAAVLLAGAAA